MPLRGKKIDSPEMIEIKRASHRLAPTKRMMKCLVQEQIYALRESVPYNIPICMRVVNKNIKAKNLFGMTALEFGIIGNLIPV